MCYTTPGSMQGYIFLFENWLELQFSCSLFSMTCFQQWEWLLYRVLKGTIARWCYENLRREAASLKIQTCYRMHHARKNYVDVCSASTTIQSGLRGMGARIKLHFKRQTKAAVIIQVLQWCCFCSICCYYYLKKLSRWTLGSWNKLFETLSGSNDKKKTWPAPHPWHFLRPLTQDKKTPKPMPHPYTGPERAGRRGPGPIFHVLWRVDRQGDFLTPSWNSLPPEVELRT